MKKKKKNNLNKKIVKIAKRKVVKSKIKLTIKSKSVKKKNILTKKPIKKTIARKAQLKTKLSKIKKTIVLKNKSVSKSKQALISKDKFEELIKKIITKLIERHKVDGLYTTKIIEKGIPKKYRTSENILKVKTLLKKQDISILSE